jgi:hypothetical protein
MRFNTIALAVLAFFSFCITVLLGIIIWLLVRLAPPEAIERIKGKPVEYKGESKEARVEKKFKVLSEILGASIKYDKSTGGLAVHCNERYDSIDVKEWKRRLAIIQVQIYDYAKRNNIEVKDIRVYWPDLAVIPAKK